MPRQFHERPTDAALQLCPANACSRCGHERSCPGSEYAAVLLAEKGLKGHARGLLSIAARYHPGVKEGRKGRFFYYFFCISS